MSRSLIVDQFLHWCEENDVNIDPRLEIQWNEETGVAVFSKGAIPPGTSVAQINKDSVLSTRSCNIASELSSTLTGPEALYGLSLALYSEILLGPASRWYGYLQSLPENTVDLPLFWSDHFTEAEIQDKELAVKWLSGTEVSKYTGKRINAIANYFQQTAEPILRERFRQHSSCSSPTLEGFYRAYSLVSSRSFLVDAYHGLAMVPIADAFNHSHENHVHIETDFSVCAECGSLQQCTHDEDDRSQSHKGSAEPRHSSDKLDPYYEMVSDCTVVPGTEVFNKYGEGLSNAQLLGRYGFIIEDNDNDTLTWEFEQIIDCLLPPLGGCDEHRVASVTRLHNIWTSILHQVAETDLLTELSTSEVVSIDESLEGSGLYLNGDGRISHSLWILLSVFSLVEGLPVGHFDSLANVMKALRSMVDYQLVMEADDRPSAGELVPAATFDRVVQLVIHLCEIRKHNLLSQGGGDEMKEPANLNDILDELPSSMHRTRAVLFIAIGECSLLDSCQSAWRDLIGLGPDSLL